MNYPYLKEYSKFLIDDCLEDLVSFSIEKARSAGLPILSTFKDHGEEHLYQYTRNIILEFLESVEQNRLKEYAAERMANWKKDAIPFVAKNEVNVKDVILVPHLRKYGMLFFIDRYTSDLEKYKQIINKK
ncbi:hypothetical protein HMI54_008402 [Coelomomyces lativittatus]|nr:hypothetical protein HMI54_008402 [Coelomomyces lativittatus]